MIPHLQPFFAWRGQERKQIDVFVTEETAGTGLLLIFVQGRVLVQAQAEVGVREFLIIEMWIATQALKHGLRNGFEQSLVA